jgi:hypothetical protein
MIEILYVALVLLPILFFAIVFVIIQAGTNNKMLFPKIDVSPLYDLHRFYNAKTIEGEVIKKDD